MELVFPANFPHARSLGGGIWLTAEDWPFFVDGIWTTVPKGFQTDLFSSPWIFQPIAPRDARDNVPALIHDWLYATVGLRATWADEPALDRAACDRALYVACRQAGFGWLQSRTYLAGVRMGGWAPWGNLRRSDYSLADPCMGRAPRS